MRQQEIRRAQRIIQGCRALGTNVVTLCTGTRDRRRHVAAAIPTTTSPRLGPTCSAPSTRLLPVAEAHGVVLGIEPEQANVIDSAVKARRLLDEVKSKQLRIVLDGANLFDPQRLGDMTAVLQEAFDLLGPDIEMVHAKDITGDETKKDQAAGTGKLDWPTYFRLMKSSGFDGPVLLHNLKPSQVATSIRFVCRASRALVSGTETIGGVGMNQFFLHDGIRFRYQATGSGLPVVFCHGLGGDLEAPKSFSASPRAIG